MNKAKPAKEISCYSCGKVEPQAPDITDGQCRKCFEAKTEANTILADNNGTGDGIPIEDETLAKPDEKSLYSKTNDAGETVRFVVQQMSSMKSERMEWIWPDKIPAGALTILAGRVGCGKSMMTCDLIARVTTGRVWPDGSKNTKGPQWVLIAATEDSATATVRPRLEAAGADLSKVLWFHRTETAEPKGRDKKITKSKRNLILDRDVFDLGCALLKHKEIALVVLDPISSFFSIKITDDKEVRPVMDALKYVCEKTGVALVTISHRNKRSDVDASQKVLGASSIAGSARQIWFFDHDPDDKTERLMSLVKSNASGNTKGMRYKVVSSEVKLRDGSTVSTGKVEWLGEHEDSADEVDAKARANRADNKDAKDTKLIMAKALISSRLAQGPQKAREMYAAAEAEGISERTMKSAVSQLDLMVYKSQGGGWMWANRATEQTIPDGEVM